MNNLFNPIDMDGVPWTGDLANYVQSLFITFSGSGRYNDTDLKPGEAKIINFEITDSGQWSGEVKAVHPLTGDLFEVSIYDSGSLVTHPASIQCTVAADIVSQTPIRLSEIVILPTALCFIDNVEKHGVAIDLRTASPLVSTVMNKKVLIEIDTQVSKYNYTDPEEGGILSINGVTPTSGNIDILGAGRTVVS